MLTPTLAFAHAVIGTQALKIAFVIRYELQYGWFFDGVGGLMQSTLVRLKLRLRLSLFMQNAA